MQNPAKNFGQIPNPDAQNGQITDPAISEKNPSILIFARTNFRADREFPIVFKLVPLMVYAFIGGGGVKYRTFLLCESFHEKNEVIAKTLINKLWLCSWLV